ncbi:GNAT family N-acetyltransferase [Duganella radicis]|uniref:GNAT family N-acetyltransferase n=1 Tax=Duganella radicis TaxID=551988 RepID=UPI001BA54269
MMALAVTVFDGALHDRNGFTCGVVALDCYLRQREHSISILIDEAHPTRILGYCALSATQLYLHELHVGDRKRLPKYPVPAMRIGRLAISQSEQGKGYGQLLLGHAVNLARAVRKRWVCER